MLSVVPLQRCKTRQETQLNIKVKEADLYSTFIEVPYTQGAQVRITQCYLQTIPYLPLPRKHSPEFSLPPLFPIPFPSIPQYFWGLANVWCLCPRRQCRTAPPLYPPVLKVGDLSPPHTHTCSDTYAIHQMAHPRLRLRTSNCSLLLIYLPQKDERLSWHGWLVT